MNINENYYFLLSKIGKAVSFAPSYYDLNKGKKYPGSFLVTFSSAYFTRLSAKILSLTLSIKIFPTK